MNASTIKALTIRQPWAWAVALGVKPIENRRQSTSHRGPTAIHSGLQWDDLGDRATNDMLRLARAQGSRVPSRFTEDTYSQLGLVLAIADLTDVCTASRQESVVVCDCGPWALPWSAHWRFADAEPLDKPVPASGSLWLWNWTPPGDARG